MLITLPLREGQSGPHIRLINLWLPYLIPSGFQQAASGDVWTADTTRQIRLFQGLHKASVDGMMGSITLWHFVNAIRTRAWTGAEIRDGLLQQSTSELFCRVPGGSMAEQGFLVSLSPWWRNLLFYPTWKLDIQANACTAFDVFYNVIFNKPVPDGLRTLLAFIAADSEISDSRWAAYMLATAMLELGDQFNLRDEGGQGAGKAYGVAVNGRTYYGRGYCQLTHEDNYATMTRLLRLSGPDDLVAHPERANDKNIAYRVLSYGMRHGSFTGVGLPRFISGGKCDYLNARKIINLMDRASEGETYARQLELCLLAGTP